MIAQFDRFSLIMTLEQARSASHAGSCDIDVQELLKIPAIQRQLKKIGPEKIREELEEYGAWDDNELDCVEGNQERIVWIAAGNIREEYDNHKTNCGKPYPSWS